MKAFLERIGQRIDGFSLRERLLVFLAVLSALGGLWFVGFYEPREQALEQLELRREQARNAMETARSQIDAVTARAQQDPNRSLRLRLAQLEAEREGLDARIAERTAGFVAPSQMAPLLRDLLRAQRGLRLISMESLPVAQVDLGLDEEQSSVPVYRHGLELVWEGDFPATRRYLRALQALPWRLNRDGLEYEVQEYPRARVRLRVHTISLYREWIGV
ncbi:hypothetical protein [Alkalilimnicola sp. S0819]|uniref:hypothetical protein n=1 Tax=Alkalilimnicola sp. S0819 TaxID=2613922 RepID=UPI001262A403|nr:hypothetical protein [Alkalilimnicola sp. S0819]KAB7622643.1 hypothetical protein F3N43_12295 [Alkalilimnicola sp. S0819]MPQ17414.1 hypothetical protein [Alkalilimnicola sp. S0819]